MVLRVLSVIRFIRILNQSVIKELETLPIVDKIEQEQFTWFGHLIRIINNFPVKLYENYESNTEDQG